MNIKKIIKEEIEKIINEDRNIKLYDAWKQVEGTGYIHPFIKKWEEKINDMVKINDKFSPSMLLSPNIRAMIQLFLTYYVLSDIERKKLPMEDKEVTKELTKLWNKFRDDITVDVTVNDYGNKYSGKMKIGQLKKMMENNDLNELTFKDIKKAIIVPIGALVFTLALSGAPKLVKAQQQIPSENKQWVLKSIQKDLGGISLDKNIEGVYKKGDSIFVIAKGIGIGSNDAMQNSKAHIGILLKKYLEKNYKSEDIKHLSGEEIDADINKIYTFSYKHEDNGDIISKDVVYSILEIPISEIIKK